ncbi:signal peptide-containing protein [Apiospora saccharicola]|uniref:Signal peptide-containing protein n=1 Tax=Apiospora saccharicola TaxID=335842 RepID=A0ABR1U2L3_9PEZI
MSFGVALQSAIFYVVACTPCAMAREHRDSKKKAKKDRAEKMRMQTEMPELYQHPDPFNTNPYWSEEITMGPRLPTKKNTASSKNTSQRGLHSSGRDSRSETASTIGMDSRYFGSSPTVVPEGEELRQSISIGWSDDWNKKRYQREDEELWGHEPSRGHKFVDAIKEAGASAGRMIEATLGMEKEPKNVTEEERTDFYTTTIKNPPVNDYHPPIVSMPKHKDAARWMLQPPPAAKIMEGKVPVSRSMSLASQASRRTAASSRSARTTTSRTATMSSRTATMTSEGPALGKRMHEKMVEKKLRQGSDTPTEAELAAALNRPSTARRSTNASRSGLSQRSTRSRSLSTESSDASPEMKKRTKRRSRVQITPESDSSDDEEFYRGNSIESLGAMTRAAQRPKLETIFSSQNTAPKKTQIKRPQSSSSSSESEVGKKLRSPSQETFNMNTFSKVDATVPEPIKDVNMTAGVAVQASA